MKRLIFILVYIAFIFLLISIISAQSLNIEFPNGNELDPGEPLIFKATLYNEIGNSIDSEISVIIEDAERRISIEKIIQSKEVITLDLGERATSGQGVITAKYQDTQAISFFEIGRKELARFELDGNILKVTNIGNTKYSRTIEITIGGTIGIKEPNLDIGETVSYMLVAPEGIYNLKVTDGKNSLIRSNVRLSGTGQVIGAIDESTSGRSLLTGGISPSEESDESITTPKTTYYFVYVFIIVAFNAIILIAIERRYKKKNKQR